MLIKIIRFNDWWFYKIPPLISIGYALLLINQIPLNNSWTALLTVLVALTSVASYGYIINDVFDVNEDQLAGKPNAFVGVPLKTIAAWVTVFILIGFAPLLILKVNKVSIFVLLINYLLPTAYSIPPVRLKERGVWGLLFDAAGAHAIPTLFVGITVLGLAVDTERSYWWLAAATCWASIYGLRGIIIHQIRDLENDVSAGVATYAVNTNINRIRILLSRIVIPLEIIFLLILTGVLFTYNAIIFFATLLYIFLELARYKIQSNDPSPGLASKKDTYIFRGDYYEVWLPMLLILSLAGFDKNYVLLFIFHFALFFKRIQVHALELHKALNFLFGKIITPRAGDN